MEGLKNGISHIEFRMLDINPFEPLGIDRNDLEFIHLLIMYLSMQDDFMTRLYKEGQFIC